MPITYFYRPTNWEEISEAMREPSGYALALVEQGAAEQVAAFFDRVITILEAQQQRGLKTGCYVSLQGGYVTGDEYALWHRHQEELDLIESAFGKLNSALGFDELYKNQWFPAEEPLAFYDSKKSEYQAVRSFLDNYGIPNRYWVNNPPIDTSAFFKYDEDKHNDSE